MNTLHRSVALLGFASLAALAMPVIQDVEFPPDLTILNADDWYFEEEGHVLVLRVEVANQSVIPAPESLVRVSGWDEFEVGVRPLNPEERVVIEVAMPIPLELAGSSQEFYLEVDPDERVPDYNRENNGYTTPPIPLPGPPEEPPSELFIEGVSPAEVALGEDFTLEVFGGGFEPGTEIFIEGVELGEVTFVNDGHLAADAFVPDDAGPGPRTVEVSNPDGSVAVLEGGLEVFGGVVEPPVEPPIEPPSGDGGILPLILIGGAIILALGAGGLALTVRLVTQSGKKALQEKAQKQDPPDECTPGRQWVKEIELEVTPGRWVVGALALTLYDAESGATSRRHTASRELVGEINNAIRTRRRPRDDEATLPLISLSAVDDLVAQVVGWQALESRARDVSLDARLEGGEAEVKFEVYRCVGQPPNTHWVKQREWKAKVKATDRHAGSVRGPLPGEEHSAYVERARRDVEARLRELVDTVARM